ncbi:MAG TPA: HAD-IA family hydrolase [Candidatus Saccharimonadales bacterium]
MIRALIFDCFGVFYSDPVFAYMRDPKTSKDKAEALHNLDDQASHGKLTKADFVKQAAQILGDSHSAVEQRFFHGDIDKALVAFVIQARKQYKTALLSNIGGDMMDGFFNQDEYDQLFDTVVLSGMVELAKPNPEIFSLVCEKLGVSLNEALMIDDMQENIDIAKSLGIQGICYRDFEQFKLEFEALSAKTML